MHVIQGGWIGQTYALATSSDAGGRKSRIRRSKEERKTMVESFIKKYQKSNKGDFPSLNLTHKEVGGSFYTVREIVREIIQENRVLAPPKKDLNKHDPPGFPEQLSLDSRPIEHQNNLSALNQLHVGELLSKSDLQFDEPKLNAEQVLNELENAEPNPFQDTVLEVSNSSKKIPSSGKGDFENEKIVNGSEGHVEDTNSDKPLIANDFFVYCDHGEGSLQSGHHIHPDPLEIQENSSEQHVNNKKLMVDDAKSVVIQVHMDMNDTEILGKESAGSDNELLHVTTLNTSSVVEMEMPVVEPHSGTALDLDGKSIELNAAYDNVVEKIAFDESHLDVDDANDENEKVAQYEPSCEDSNLSVMSGPQLEKSNANDSDPKSSSLNEMKVGISTTKYALEGGVKSNRRHNNGVKKMDRINLETWKGASKEKESNPVLALVKVFLSAVFKLWYR